MERWVRNFNSSFHEEYLASPAKPWVLDSGKVAGTVRSASRAVEYVEVFDAG